VLRQNSAELFVLTRLRDEAHRFAITFHQKLRRARNFKSILEEIPGVGEKRRKALLRHFGSLKRIKSASIPEIAEVEGFNEALARRVCEFLARPAEDPDRETELPEGAAQSMDEDAELGEAMEDEDEALVEELEAASALVAQTVESTYGRLPVGEPALPADDAAPSDRKR
jgi:excinuclease ABC subunit C